MDEIMDFDLEVFADSKTEDFSMKQLKRCPSNASANSKRYPGQPARVKFQKLPNPAPPGKFFGLISGGRASLGPLIITNFTLFHHFQYLSH